RSPVGPRAQPPRSGRARRRLLRAGSLALRPTRWGGNEREAPTDDPGAGRFFPVAGEGKIGEGGPAGLIMRAQFLAPVNATGTALRPKRSSGTNAMLRLRDVTIKAKLYGLILSSVVCLWGVLGLAFWVLYESRINGPLYNRLSLRAAVLGEIEPATFYVARPYLVLLELGAATDAAEVRQLTE